MAILVQQVASVTTVYIYEKILHVQFLGMTVVQMWLHWKNISYQAIFVYFWVIFCFMKIRLLGVNRQKLLVKMKNIWSVKADIHLSWQAVITACTHKTKLCKYSTKNYITLIMAKFFSHSVTSAITESIQAKIRVWHLFRRGPPESHKTTPLKSLLFFFICLTYFLPLVEL